ncbi:hypothetical protein K470DRAFT_261164 [Piedraia hortae CBS 480.64]|uniref:Isopenicillin N synthase-like Fe(2+) 2OG dioxygenase domain-containing protein n=1 Tax=Piedraia hortae CBS 480.64 TaxID=1314780 RepID=A0A6A7BNN4_9PEZI|nr:hypothetical protein K470DRAFT_261164 [Piedraia hortae CBS 480.64]
MDEFLPPQGPPPLLDLEQIYTLAYQGWLKANLKPEMTDCLHQLSVASDTFFAMDETEKRSLYPPTHGTECGYYRVVGEKEYVTLRYSRNPELPLEQCASDVWQHLGAFLHRILCDLSRAAELGVHVWDNLVANSLTLPKDGNSLNNITTLLRLFKYLPEKGISEPHVDIGLLTLCVGRGRGLQVLDHNVQPPAWIDVDGPVVLIGDFTRALLQQKVRAAMHRVVGNPNGRASIVFALRPYLVGNIDLKTFGGEGMVDARQYFLKVKGSKYNVNAIKEVREKQRKLQEQKRAAAEKEAAQQMPQKG